MSKTVIQAELPPELVRQAESFVQQTGQKDVSELVEEALQEFLRQHPIPLRTPSGSSKRQQVFESLASQAESCAKAGWDGYGAEPVTQEAYRCAYRFVASLPAGFPMPGVGAEPDGHLTLEWYRSPSQVLSVSVGPGGELHYAALLGEKRRRTGSEDFQEEVPGDLKQLIQQVVAA